MSVSLSEQLKNQIDYIRIKVKNRENTGLELIDLLANKDAIDWIHQEAESMLRSMILSYCALVPANSEVIFMSLSLIGLMKYDGDFYENVRSTYIELYKDFSDQRIEGAIRTVLNHYRTEKDKTGHKYINAVLMNVIVPVHFLPGFFDFIFDIYKYNFECNLTDHLQEDFRFVYEGLEQVMRSGGDNVQIQVTHKSYKLIESTKRLIASGQSLDAVIGLSIRVVKFIDNRYWGRENDISNPYFKEGYEKWEKTYTANGQQGVAKVKTKYRSQWEPRYLLEQNYVYLAPPVHKISDLYDYADIVAIIKCDGVITWRKEKPYIREIIGGYEVNIDKIKLDNPLNDVTYELMAGNEFLYSSKETLYRKYIVFNEKGREIHNNTDYSGTAIVCAPLSWGKPYYHTQYYGLTEMTVDEETILSFGKDVFGFSSLVKPDVFGEEYVGQYLKQKNTGKLLKVFSRVDRLMFESEYDNVCYELIINSQVYELSYFKHTKMRRNSLWRYIVHLQDIVAPGINEVSVIELTELNKSQIAHFKFVYDPLFKLEETQINDYTYEICVKTVLCDSLREETLDLLHYSEDWFMIDFDGESYSYILPLDIGLYRIKGGNWRLFNQDLWIDDITPSSKIEFLGTKIDAIILYSDIGAIIQGETCTKDEKWYRTVAIGALTSYKEEHNYTWIALCSKEKTIGVIFCYNRCVFNSETTEITFDPVLDHLLIQPCYRGKGDVVLEIRDDAGELVYSKENLMNEQNYTIEGLQSFVYYQLCFYEKQKGLSFHKKRELMKRGIRLYARSAFVGKYFLINEVQYNRIVQGELLQKIFSLQRTYVYFASQLTNDTFEGNIVLKTKNGCYTLSGINPVQIEICSNVIDGEMEIAITKDGDGLLLDFRQSTILDNLDADRAPDIFSYTIDIDGVKTL